MENVVVNDKGEKVIMGSRRPDGTLRKERRVRAGYTPQDEQPTYVSAGAAWKQGAARVPGYDAAAEATAAAVAAAKSKAAKKNEKRKAKKAEEGPAPASAAPAATAAAATAPPLVAPAAAPSAVGNGSAAGGGDGGPVLAGQAALVDRQIKALSKKVRQCQALVSRETGGSEALTEQEREKVAKLPGWQKEIHELQQLMAGLAAS